MGHYSPTGLNQASSIKMHVPRKKLHTHATSQNNEELAPANMQFHVPQSTIKGQEQL